MNRVLVHLLSTVYNGIKLHQLGPHKFNTETVMSKTNQRDVIRQILVDN